MADSKAITYEYSGYLKTVLKAPDPGVSEKIEGITFSIDDIATWTTRDADSDKEWQNIPVQRSRTEDAVRLTGRFDETLRIDNLAIDDPSFWVALGTLGWQDWRLPIDVAQFPIAEITYRCITDNARPAWIWRYDGGLQFDWLPPTRRWRTIVRRVPHFGFPSKLTGVIIRLYSPSRTTETIDVKRVRFRVQTHEEWEAATQDEARHLEMVKPTHAPILDEFLPLGVYMSGESTRRLAQILGISLVEYWNLAFEDLVLHRHNCVFVEDVERFSKEEWKDLLSAALAFGIRLVPMRDSSRYETLERQRQYVDEYVKPYAKSKAILAWSMLHEPPEHDFSRMIRLRDLVEKADPNHPVALVTRHPSAYPLYAPFFAASGINHFTSHAPWEIGDIVRTHLPLNRGQQFWMVAPAFVYATGTPEWSSCAEMRLMINLAFANGARGWAVYAYHNDPIWMNGSCQRSLTGPFLMFSDLWAELGERMERYQTLAPLLLQARPARMPDQWYLSAARADTNTQLPPDVPPVSSFRLRGADFNLYFVVSNDVRGMASVNVAIPPEALEGLEIYDVFDFAQTREWKPMNPQRHLEMFPGQARVVLVAAPEVCARWGAILAERLIEEDRRQLGIHLKLARTYNLDLTEIETLMTKTGTGDAMQDLRNMDLAHDLLFDLMYSTPAIYKTRSRIIEASAAICACDGALCRLLGRGLVGEARELGQRVVPYAREVTHLRLELRQGRGEEILEQCEDLVDRVLKLLAEIRGKG